MAKTDPKRAALVRALMERDLYEMLNIPHDADEAEIRTAIATRTEWVEETPMRAAARDAEMHWLAWSERALINDPEIRADYDAELGRKAAAADRGVESRQRVRKLHVARDQLAKRESERVVQHEVKKPKAVATPTTAERSRTESDPPREPIPRSVPDIARNIERMRAESDPPFDEPIPGSVPPGSGRSHFRGRSS